MYGLSFSHLMDSKRLNPAARPASATNVARRNNPTAGDASKGFLVVDGRKVPIERPRLRSEQGREQRLGSYELFRRSPPSCSGTRLTWNGWCKRCGTPETRTTASCPICRHWAGSTST